jgi:hypothetical protein
VCSLHVAQGKWHITHWKRIVYQLIAAFPVIFNGTYLGCSECLVHVTALCMYMYKFWKGW